MAIEAKPTPAPALAQGEAGARERALRQRLGIPQAAARVLIFGETSHWDPNWLYTTEEYYEQRIWRIIDAALAALAAEPRRIFAFESTYFLKLYWERNPAKRERLRALINEGRLRLTGTGVTTPDTVLPHTEAILRDYLHGQEWLRKHGLRAEPKLAYLPDDFGYSPALPSVLAALGFEMAGVTRIDGMYFVGCDYRPKSRFPLPGSNAELLLRDHRTLDFVWRGPDGAEVLTHWNAFTYFQGDMLACVGAVRWMGTVFGWSRRSEAHVARRIQSYIKALGPLARTPYLFCPIGCDFNDPIEGLVGLVERYNEQRFAQSGVWAVVAGMEDYLELVNCHREHLPVLQLDPNPYWMGFYASRQEAKLLSNRVARKLVLAEKLYALPTADREAAAELEANIAAARAIAGGRGATTEDAPVGPWGPRPLDAPAPGERRGYSALGLEAPASRRVERLATGTVALWRDELERAWDLLVLSNHHDFITGTSPDRVWKAEQQPWLREAEALVDTALARVQPTDLPGPGSDPAPRWQLDGGELQVETDHYRVRLSEAAGGCLVSFVDRASGAELLAGPANDLVSYRDSGGLWRMGHEYAGGTFRERARASALPARLQAEEQGDRLEVRVESELSGQRFVRSLWFRNGTPIVRLRLTGSAARRRTITCAFPTAFAEARTLAMDVPGGVVERPAHKLYDPTFWPARSFVHLHHPPSDRGLAVFLGGPAAPALRGKGVLEWLAFRNAPREVAFGVLPVLAHPARGTDPDPGSFDYAVWFTRAGDHRANHLPRQVRHALRAALFAPEAPDLDERANAAIVTDDEQVLVSALKPASRGSGLIARLRAYGPLGGEIRLRCSDRPLRAARRCDARERDLGELALVDGACVVPIDASIVSVRLLF